MIKPSIDSIFLKETRLILKTVTHSKVRMLNSIIWWFSEIIVIKFAFGHLLGISLLFLNDELYISDNN